MYVDYIHVHVIQCSDEYPLLISIILLSLLQHYCNLRAIHTYMYICMYMYVDYEL